MSYIETGIAASSCLFLTKAIIAIEMFPHYVVRKLYLFDMKVFCGILFFAKNMEICSRKGVIRDELQPFVQDIAVDNYDFKYST